MSIAVSSRPSSAPPLLDHERLDAYRVAVAVARQIGVPPASPALDAAMASSLGNMLPVSTAPNAIVYGGGWIRLRDMALAGLLIDVGGALVIWGVVTLLAPLLGLG